ncbi:MAG: SDR family oxidoreductase [Gammaproteobacteria bacterium]|nr:SDR family oxidoreductase [Gammaproteobacteria bacterium]
MSNISLEGKVAIVTGAGGGLGRSHAKLLASLGASVVVNDLGCSVDGSGETTPAAQVVVDEIIAAGGKAVANMDSVTDRSAAANIVRTAIDTFGGLHILVNNAGILRDKSFAKVTDAEWDAVIDTHLNGTYNVTKAAWPIFKEQKYGRIVMTASGSGMFGNFGQANYGAAKSGIIGFAKALSHEGAKYDVKTNILCPAAASRMTENLMPPQFLEKLKPEAVSPIVAYMCTEEINTNGAIFEAGAGSFAHANWARSKGYKAKDESGVASVDEIASAWEDIMDMSEPKVLDNPQAAMAEFMS